MPLNNELCITIPTLIDLNLVELDFYQFVISLDKCNAGCNVVDDLFTKKKSIPRETKDVDISSKCKFNSTT